MLRPFRLGPHKVTISNPYVIIIGVSKYANPQKQADLPGVTVDVRRLGQLWGNTFHYHTHIIDSVDNTTRSRIMDQLNDAQGWINFSKHFEKDLQFDSLIIHIAGHGIHDALITYDDLRIRIKTLIELFSGTTILAPNFFKIKVCKKTTISTGLCATLWCILC